MFDLAGKYCRFICLAGFTDEASNSVLRADFSVLGDGRPLATVRDVASELEPVLLQADMRGVQRLELIVKSRETCLNNVVWLDPQGGCAFEFVHETKTLLDCLERVEIVMPSQHLKAQRCIATVVSPGYTEMLDEMLASLRANGRCESAAVVSFCRGSGCRMLSRRVEVWRPPDLLPVARTKGPTP